MNKIEKFGIELTEEQWNDLRVWLIDKRGIPFWDWIAGQSQYHHNHSSRPIGDNPIRDIITSQRNLEAENAFDRVLSFAKEIKTGE